MFLTCQILNSFSKELSKLGYIAVYDPKKGRPVKPIKQESVDLPIVVHREDAGEQGGSISSSGSPMSCGGI